MRANILAFAAGVVLLQFQAAVPAWGVAGMAGGIVLLPLGFGNRAAWIKLIGVIACCAIGFGWAAWRAESRLADALPAEWEGRDVDVVGVIAALPQGFAHGSRFEFDVETVLTSHASLPGRIMLSWYQGRYEDEMHQSRLVRPGERWRFTVRLKRPHGNANPQGFDYEAWLFERNIRATGYVRAAPAERLAPWVWSAAYVVERTRDHVRNAFLAMLPPERYPYAGILVALAIGDQRAIQGDLWTVFSRTGVTHLLSVSGLHVTLVAAMLAATVGALWRRVPTLALRFPAQRAAIAAGWLAAFGYAWLAGFGVPAQRTLYMLSVAALALLSGRTVAPSRVLCLALLAVLVLDPWAVTAAGFWLSFGAVAALFFVGAASVGQAGAWRGKLRAWGAVQWAATLASLPILLLLFQQFSLVSPLANAVAIPVVSFLVTPLALLAAVLPWWPLLEAAHALLVGLMAFLNWCSAWPVWTVPAPPLWAALAGGFGVLLLLLPSGLPLRFAAMALLLPVLFWPAPVPPAGSARITVLDVGQGLAAVVRTQDHALVYDPGPLYSAESNAGQRIVVPYLRAQGIDRLDRLIITHRDSDHAGGASSVLAALPVDEILGSVPEYGGRACLAGQNWQWNGVQFSILHPDEAVQGAGGKANHVSCVLRIEAGGASMLLTSDIEARDEAAMLRRNASAVAADVLLVPHHGSRTSSTTEFIAAVAPKLALVPVGYRSRFGHPKPEVLARYEEAGVPVLRTDYHGAIDVELRPDGFGISAWRQERRRYWHGR